LPVQFFKNKPQHDRQDACPTAAGRFCNGRFLEKKFAIPARSRQSQAINQTQKLP
jgi:hypothetical protein